MIKVHFTELEDMAVRGPLERGLRYAFCHNKTEERCSDFPDYDENGREVWETPQAFASENVLASGIVYYDYLLQEARLGQNFWTRRVRDEEITPEDVYTWRTVHEKNPVFFYWHQGFAGHSMFMSYASDAGLWDVPGIGYKNNTNYVLDVHALRRQGIELDLSPRKG